MEARLNKEDLFCFLSERKEDLFRKYQLTKFGIFGSVARNQATSVSHIDIILEFMPDTEDIYDKKDA